MSALIYAVADLPWDYLAVWAIIVGLYGAAFLGVLRWCVRGGPPRRRRAGR